MEGMGTYKYRSGDVYEGEWSGDKKHGHGIFKNVDGSSLEGDYVKNKKNGEFIKVEASGKVHLIVYVDDEEKSRETL